LESASRKLVPDSMLREASCINGALCGQFGQSGRGLAVSGMPVIQGQKGRVGVFTSASPRCLDAGDVDLLHRHHCLEGTLGLTATSRKRVG
jgi:hypothetical protein